jgi:hypothetical protein
MKSDIHPKKNLVIFPGGYVCWHRYRKNPPSVLSKFPPRSPRGRSPKRVSLKTPRTAWSGWWISPTRWIAWFFSWGKCVGECWKPWESVVLVFVGINFNAENHYKASQFLTTWPVLSSGHQPWGPFFWAVEVRSEAWNSGQRWTEISWRCLSPPSPWRWKTSHRKGHVFSIEPSLGPIFQWIISYHLIDYKH